MRIIKRILSSLLLAGCLPTVAFAAQTITVANHDDSGDGSLRQAVIDAADGDTVSIPADIDEIILTSGQIQIVKDITIQGAGAGTSIIDGGANDRIFEIGDGLDAPEVTISGVTIKNGKVDGDDGGGILVDSGSALHLENTHIGPDNTAVGGGAGIFLDGFLTVVNSTIDGNHADGNGGGIFCTFGTADLTDTTVSNNQSGFSGGGIFSNGCKITLRGTSLGPDEGCNIIGNTSDKNGGGFINDNSDAELLVDTCSISGNTAANGGGIANGNVDNISTTILNSLITGNHAIGGDGGGISDGFFGGAVNETLTIIDRTTISNNDASLDGGGYFKAFPTDPTHITTITNTTISSNHAARNGGGISADGPINISNTTVFHNDAKGSGGGIFNTFSSFDLNNVTIAGNIADNDGQHTDDSDDDGGGIAGSDGGSIAIRNTLIADNLDNSPTGPKDTDCSTTSGLVIDSKGHNLIGVTDADCVISGDTTGNIVNQPAKLDPNGLQANGSDGPMTVALVDGSPAIDAGDSVATATDERGVARTLGLAPDIGAFESDFGGGNGNTTGGTTGGTATSGNTTGGTTGGTTAGTTTGGTGDTTGGTAADGSGSSGGCALVRF
jgi:predicted outer membrane repeat protein